MTDNAINAVCIGTWPYIQHSLPYAQCVEMRFAAQVIAETPPAFDDDIEHETP